MAFGSFDNGRGSSPTLSEINMVPLIDVMLVLLVIFIITAPLLSHTIQIQLPRASSTPMEQDPVVVDLAIDAQGQVFWNEQAVDAAALDALMQREATQDPQPELRIRADLNTRYEVLAHVMSQAKKAGLRRIGFLTRPEPAAAGDGAALPAVDGG